MALLGVRLSQSQKFKFRTKKGSSRRGKKRDDDVSYDLSRFVPALKTCVQDLVDGKLGVKEYPFVRDPATPGTYGALNVGKSAQRMASNSNLSATAAALSVPSNVQSLRSTKPSWHNRKGGSDASASMTVEPKVSVEERKRAGRIIVFVAGGMTYSEVRAAYELGNATKKDIIIGRWEWAHAFAL